MALKMILLFILGHIILDAHLIDGGPCQVVVKDELIEGPKTLDDFNCWFKAMNEFRQSEREKIDYNDVNYRRPELQWTQRDVLQPQMMVHDRDFYDYKTHEYTVDKYVNRLKQRYGGIDSVLIWPTYPNIGIDNRNTDDMMRDMPHGINGIKKMISEFHQHNIKVLFPIHPWDQGTRDPGHDWSVILPKTMAEINADGLNGDTMLSVNKEYFDNSVRALRPLALEPELGFIRNGISGLAWNVMSWGYWDRFNYTRPMISRNKWIETRHQVHVCNRWSKSKINNLQMAFFNGVGMETWENVWGIWNQMTDRDCHATEMVASILRKFSSLVTSNLWMPFYKTIQEDNLIFASQWPGTENTTLTLWTLINRSDKDINGSQLEVLHNENNKYYDLWHGIELHPEIKDRKAILQFPIEKYGFGAILSGKEKDLPNDFANFMLKMKQYSKRPLSSYPDTNIVVKQKMVPIESSKQYKSAPQGMILIDAANYTFEVSGTEIEGGNNPGVDVQYPWEKEPTRKHKHVVEIKKFYMDKTPVTNDQYNQFMKASKYSPVDNHNFLNDWNIHGEYPKRWSNKPVTWISIEDARAYCRWAGKRLPHEWEWQYAAQGHDGRKYPWGNTFDSSRVPKPVLSRNLSSPADVAQFTNGASPFGVLHLVGNVWQWTDEYIDDHTRAAVVRGGSYYQAQTSKWYFPSDETYYSLNFHNKYLLMAPSLDRAATLGFRCAADSQ